MITPILLAVDQHSPDLTSDDRHLARSLAADGFAPIPHQWGAPVPERSLVLIRSTWDYIEHPTPFAAWLDHLDAQRAIVHNATSTLRWNASKHYLLDLHRLGVPTVPTEVVAQGSACELHDLMRERGWTDVVVKPAIGGTARLALTSARNGIHQASQQLRRITAHEDAIVQPYLPSITTEGETSIVAVGGTPRLAVMKRPRSGDWRVQTDFGGTARVVPLTDELVTIAHDVLATLDPTPSYARVDVGTDEHGDRRLLELELVEPELFFRLDPSVATDLTNHIKSHLEEAT